MAKGKVGSFSSLWEKHEERYLSVFSMALVRLSKKKMLSGDEDSLSEQLNPIFRTICFEIKESQGIEIDPPFWETPIPPVEEKELTGGKAKKRPDFTCTRVNTYSTSSSEYMVSLHVECKKLGNPTTKSPGRKFTKEYVTEGIQRFDKESHKYGNQVPSGIMIGYIVNMSPETINNEVNDFQKKYLPDNESFAFNFDEPYPFKTQQKLERKEVFPRKFELIHLWIDLRSSYRNTDHS